MSKRVGAANGDYELIRSAQETLNLIRAARCLWDISIRDTGRRGVLEVDCRAFEVLADGETAQVARYRAEWPNSTPGSFAAHLFLCTSKLAMMVEEWLDSPF